MDNVFVIFREDGLLFVIKKMVVKISSKVEIWKNINNRGIKITKGEYGNLPCKGYQFEKENHPVQIPILVQTFVKANYKMDNSLEEKRESVRQIISTWNYLLKWYLLLWLFRKANLVPWIRNWCLGNLKNRNWLKKPKVVNLEYL